MIETELDIYPESLALKSVQCNGFTFDCKSGTYPETGFAVATFPGAEMLVIGPVLLPSTIRHYMRTHAALLEQPGAHLGAWATTNAWGEPRWFLDVSTVVQDRESALALGKLHNQLAIFDLAKKEEILV